MLLFCEIGLKLNKQHNSINSFSFFITESVFDTYFKIPKKLSSRDKFDCYDTIANNTTLKSSVKDNFVDIFYLSQKSYWVLYRFVHNVYLYKKRKSKDSL